MSKSNALSMLAMGVAASAGGGGTSDYTQLSNKPKINNVELTGNKTTSDLGINIPTKTSDLQNDSGFLTQHQSLADYSTTSQMNTAISAHHDSSKQDTLTAGENITIENNVISATGSVPTDITCNSITTGEEIGEPSTTGYVSTQYIRAEGDAYTYYHAIDINDENSTNFYEYGGEFGFYLIQDGSKGSREELLKITDSDVTYKGDSLLGKSAVSGENDGTNWTSITIDSDTYAIPSGGGSTEDCVKTVPQVISDSQFTQCMTNLGLGAGRAVVNKLVANKTDFEYTGSTYAQIRMTNHSGSWYTTNSFIMNWTWDGVDYTKTITYPSSARGNITIQEGGLDFIYTYDSGIMGMYWLTQGTQDKLTAWEFKEAVASTEYTPINSNYINVTDPLFKAGQGTDSITYKNNTSKSTGTGSVYLSSYEGTNASGAIGNACVAIGGNTNYPSYAQGDCAIAILGNAQQGSIAIGRQCRASGSSGVAIGSSSFGSGGVAIGNEANANSMGSIVINGNSNDTKDKSYSTGATVIGSGLEMGCAVPYHGGGVALGKFNLQDTLWSSDVTYNTGDYAVYKANDSYPRLYKSLQDNNNSKMPTSYPAYWQQISDNDEIKAHTKLLVIGNGTAYNARSNALTVDWNGNLVCNNIPAAPQADGNYVLKCSISGGVATYSWVAE